MSTWRSFASRIMSCAIVLMLSSAAAAVPVDREIKFTNKEGAGNADDLHLSFSMPTTVVNDGPFTNNRPKGLTVHNLVGAPPITPDSSVTVIFRSDPKVKINEWWWTLGGNNNRDGTIVGTKNEDTGASNLSFLGGAATGDGAIAVAINAATNIFTTTAGDSPEASTLAFLEFLDGLVDGPFALVHSVPITTTSLEFFGNLLGDPSTELNARVLAQDSTQNFELVPVPTPIPEPGATALIWITAALVVSAGLARSCTKLNRRFASRGTPR